MSLRDLMQVPTCRPQHVLLVEADSPLARSLQHALEERGHVVQHAANARRAIECSSPDVLIATVDCDAGFSGFELLETFQGRAFRPRAVFLTDRPSLTSCQRALRLGAVAYLEKPVRADVLLDAVEPTQPVAPGPLQSLQLRLVSGPHTAERSVRQLLAFALERGIGPTCRARLGTAVAEVIGNACRHAYPGGAGPIELAARLEDRRMVVGVRDFGLGFDSEGLGSSWLGGTQGATCDGGLARVASLAEECVVQSRPSAGTFVQLGFAVYRAVFDTEPPEVDLSEQDFFSSELAAQVLRGIQLGGADAAFHLTPALAVTVGRMLTGPDPRRVLQTAFRS